MQENKPAGNKRRVRKLSEYCQIELMKNPKLLENVANVPYHLLEDVFKQINLEPEHLMKLEESNIFFIFEDDDLWLDFLTKEYPTNIPYSYVSNKRPIENYYMKIYDKYEKQLNEYEIDLFDRYVMNKLRKDTQRNKYKIPSRMLFEQYYKDAEKKKMKSAERLRQSVHKLDEERKKNQTTTVDYSKFMQTTQSNKGRKRKEYWDDRNPIKSIDKYNSSQHRDMPLKPPPARIAFGGVAGRPLNKMPTIIRSPMTEIRNSISKPMTPLIRQKSNISDNDNDSHSDLSKSDSDVNHSPKKKRPFPSSRRNQPTQNIFLKKRTPTRVNVTTTKQPENNDNTPTGHQQELDSKIKQPSNTTIPTRRPNKTRSVNSGTKKKRSKFFHHTGSSTEPEPVSSQNNKPVIKRHIPRVHMDTIQQQQPKEPSKPAKRLTSLKNYLTNKGVDPR
ncbi:similar to Saccharomyces cerevisiae YNL230C ELA1 Elongin A [Maudiozyma saulgeensis]|uniref:Similar to Saccharomyces cerevisiae YNL230C ELA1 Elongin A n=1 Tax=Maudiozyma saulgeensis TaxID=1789683 RepID=A0A1X7R2L0_9SACH|nr:similar to Saccharomyces cerevisiae YNL230C ELA1 Elongin A [Kazachstania saulgeensis]